MKADLLKGMASSFLPFLAFGAGNALLFSVSLKTSVPERASYGTEYAFGVKKGFLGYATRFQRHSV